MNEESYMTFIRLCLLAFALIRAPYKLQMQISYDSKTKLFPSTNYAVKEIAGMLLCFVGIVVIPLLWRPDRFESGDIDFTNSVRIAGSLVCILGLIVFWLSHHYLGKNFNQVVALRVGHRLVRNGIYRYIRHPMYSSIYLLAIGIFLASSNWIVGLSAFLGIHIMYQVRVEKEETLLVMEFGEEYRDYIKSTGRLIPKIKVVN